MLNPFKEVNWKPGLEEKRKFAWSLVLGFPVLAVIFLLMGRLRTGAWHLTFPLTLGVIGFSLGLLLLALPLLAKPFYVIWYFLGCCIGLVVGNVLLAGVFYLLVTPLGFLKRAFGNRPIRKTFDKGAPTYWRDASQNTDPQRYYSQF
jgi:hypothetical protein